MVLKEKIEHMDWLKYILQKTGLFPEQPELKPVPVKARESNRRKF